MAETIEKVQLVKKKGKLPNKNEYIYYPMVKPKGTKSINRSNHQGNSLAYNDMVSACTFLADAIREALQTGYNFNIPGIGTFKLKVKDESKTDPDKLKVNKNIKCSVNFTLDKEFSESISPKYTYAGGGIEEETPGDNTVIEDDNSGGKSEVE